MENLCRSFSFASLLILTLIVGHGRSEHCKSDPDVDLSQIELDLVWIEPGHFRYPAPYNYFSKNRATRLGSFQDKFGTGFKKSRISWARMTDDRTDFDCLKIFTPENGGTEAFANLVPPQTTAVLSNQMAAVFATKHLQPPPSRGPASKAAPVLRAVVLFTEELPTHPEPGNGPSFTGTEADTCASNYPVTSVVQKVFMEKEIAYLVVTDSVLPFLGFEGEFPLTDGFYFRAYLLEPSKLAAYEDAVATSNITSWVNQALKGFACDIYAQKTKPIASAATTPSATSTVASTLASSTTAAVAAASSATTPSATLARASVLMAATLAIAAKLAVATTVP